MSFRPASSLPVAFLSLFFSLGTLLCCALPALLVSIGLGATLAGLTSSFPELIWLSEHKEIVFGIATVALLIAGLSIYRSRNLPCPIDPKLRAACVAGRVWSVRIYMLTLICFGIGTFFAFLAPFLT